MGRPAFKPTAEHREIVAEAAGFGLPQEKICLLIKNGTKPITEKTLRKHFREELDAGLANADFKILKTLFAKALGGDTACLIFWAKARCGMSETVNVNHGGEVAVNARESLERKLARLAADGNTQEVSQVAH